MLFPARAAFRRQPGPLLLGTAPAAYLHNFPAMTGPSPARACRWGHGCLWEYQPFGGPFPPSLRLFSLVGRDGLRLPTANTTEYAAMPVSAQIMAAADDDAETTTPRIDGAQLK